MDRVKRIWYLSPVRAAKVQASLRNRAVSPEPSLLAHTSSESRGTFRQKTRSLAPLNGWACAVKICHDGMLEDTNSLDVAQMILFTALLILTKFYWMNECKSFLVLWYCSRRMNKRKMNMLSTKLFKTYLGLKINLRITKLFNICVFT